MIDASTPRLVCAALILLASAAAQAQSVALGGLLGSKALLIIDGGAPRAMGAGESFQAVKVISVTREAAVVEAGGKQLTLRLGEAPASVGARGGPANGNRIVLTSDSRGHFTGQGSINGNVMQYLVDTGATAVAIGEKEAERMRLDFRSGPAINLSTANGSVRGWQLKLDTVRIGDINVYGVEAVVVPQAMPYVLLGNTFLTQFQMTRTNDQMVLEKRP